jgi:hypothetical protein
MASILYVDPASISTGWALFVDGVLQQSGTIVADKKDNVFKRLYQIYVGYRKLGIKPDEVHIEQLVRNTHIYTHWSVSVIALGLFHSNVKVGADIPISSWQKFVNWKEDKTPLQIYKRRVSSEDELAAIGMGLWHSSKIGGVGKKSRRKKWNISPSSP